jgi:predicted transcriptional regulator
MISTIILENIAYKLTHIGKQFLDKALLLKILAVAQAKYDIKHLVQA